MRDLLLTLATLGAAFALGPAVADAQVPKPTPMLAGTPAVDLAAPTDVQYAEADNAVTWTDNAAGEEGYRVVVTFGSETRSFDVGADVEELQIPGDFRPGCPKPGANIEISVTAFAGAVESEPGTSVLPGLCPPATETPRPGLPSFPLPEEARVAGAGRGPCCGHSRWPVGGSRCWGRLLAGGRSRQGDRGMGTQGRAWGPWRQAPPEADAVKSVPRIKKGLTLACHGPLGAGRVEALLLRISMPP